MEIRQVSAEERAAALFPVQAYAFRPSPWAQADATKYQEALPYRQGTVSFIAEEDGQTLAAVSAIPMRQNIRGVVHPMAGIASVASHPAARRRGLVRALLDRLLREMRDTGFPVSTLYPFKPSFYERFGYVGLPRRRTATFAPSGLAQLMRAELPGTVTREHIRDGYAAYRALTLRMLAERHGFAVFGDEQAVLLRDTAERWVAVARVGGEVVGAVTYRIAAYGGDLIADDLLTTGPLGRALLLQFFGRHVDQVARVVVSVGADEVPELWATDLAAHTEGTVAFPQSGGPMARVLSLEPLAGLPVGSGGVTVEVAGDGLLSGRYRLQADAGRLVVDVDPGAEPDATLSAPGLSGLLYGVLDPVEVVVRGLGTVQDQAVDQLRGLFPRALPYLFADF